MSTIVGIATAPGIGGVGIIRISGTEAFSILEKIFVPKNKRGNSEIKGYTIKYGTIIDPKDNGFIDEVLVSYFKAPRSYTTEDVCEINSHGGNVIMKRILEICLENGAELAEAGEFTKRAFLNGRIDLAQVESVIDIINAKSQKEAKVAINQLEGFLSKEIKSIRKDLMSIMVEIEAAIDYPEYDIEEVTTQKILEVLKRTKEKLGRLEKSFDNGKIIREGIRVAIIGSPNAGKSSLLNAILREERAIVSEYEGTTRDTIEEFVSIEGIPLKIIDTAGIRSSKDEIEKIGITRAKEVAKEADLIIAIFDASKELGGEDKEILEIIKNKKAVILLNKTDLETIIKKTNPTIVQAGKEVIEISALNKKGLTKLYEKIVEMFNFNEINLDSEIIVTNTRHKALISNAVRNADRVLQTINEKMPTDIIAIHIKETLEDLGYITGENVSEDIIKEIFAKFCLGK